MKGVVSMSSRSVSIRISTAQLAAIDRYCDLSEDEYSRSDFMTRCAVVQAQKVLKQKAPSYVMSSTLDDATTTITISLNARREAIIVQACDMLHQRLSLFIVWATIAQLERLAA